MHPYQRAGRNMTCREEEEEEEEDEEIVMALAVLAMMAAATFAVAAAVAAADEAGECDTPAEYHRPGLVESTITLRDHRRLPPPVPHDASKKQDIVLPADSRLRAFGI